MGQEMGTRLGICRNKHSKNLFLQKKTQDRQRGEREDLKKKLVKVYLS